jgi:hypothetical protein
MSVGGNGKADNDRNKNDRDDWQKTPKGTAVNGGESPDTTFHHLIPYNNIWPTWNKLLRSATGADAEDQETNWRNIDWRNNSVVSAVACLKTWLELLGHKAPEDLTSKLVVARAGGEKISRDDCDWLSVNLLWTGWNIVEGPLNTIRADDPDEKYDDFEEPLRLIGLNKQAGVAYEVRGLNAAFQEFRGRRSKLKTLVQNKDRDAQVPQEEAGQGVKKRMRAYPNSLPASRAQYDDAFKTVATAFERVKSAVDLTGCGFAKPLTTIDLRMWVNLSPPRIQGKPWLTGTAENRVLHSLRQGMQNVQALAQRIGYH